MTEIEDRLRAMLDERAEDIEAPPAVPSADSISAARPGDGRSHRPRAWLLSAAAIGAVAIGLGALLVGTNPRDDTVGTVGTPTPSATAPALPAAGPVKPTHLDPTAVPGYSVRATGSYRGWQDVAWHRDLDSGRASSANTGSPASVQGIVLGAGRFPADTLLTSAAVRGRVTVDGVNGYRAELRQFRAGRATGPDVVDSIAWQFAPNRWAIVQKMTDAVSGSELARLAAALHPADTVPYTVPFRFAVLASSTLVEVTDNRPYYPQTLRFTGDGVTILVQVHDASDRTIDKRGWTPLRVDGLRGYLDPAGGGYVEFAGGVLTMRVTGGRGATQTAVVEKLLATVRWSGRDGSGPPVPLLTALGG